ncbi:MAG: 50S ribosome-binding GTPase, partial [Collinsella intestinalis]|nr:50S ribosome-binding GTPase [Collinsella intestinalis]
MPGGISIAARLSNEYVSKPREKKDRMANPILHIALAGNPNCGKTTLFNLITG